MPFFTVVIPALNEENYISNVLDALKRQSFKDFEVVIVDNNSSDKTVKIVNGFTKDFPLEIVTTAIRNISRCRNLGAAKAKGEYLVFIDADNSIYPNFLENIKNKLSNHKYDMIIPAVVTNSGKKVYEISYKLINIMVDVSNRIKLSFSTGGNIIILKNAFEKIGGFDENIFVGEDHDIVKRAKKGKLKVKFIPEIKIIFSTRRFEKEGTAVIFKYFIATLYIAFFGKITRKIYNYRMGGDYFKGR